MQWIAIGFGLLLSSIDSSSQTNLYGVYLDPINVQFNEDGRNMTLLDDARYRDPKGVIWHAKKNSEINGASIPKVFWSFTGGPFEGKYRNASVFHDVECSLKARSWQQVHLMFYHGMRCSGVSEIKAKAMYYAVYRFGPRWELKPKPRKKLFGLFSKKQSPDKPEPEEFYLVVTQNTKDISPSSMEKILRWVEATNPSLEEIEKEQ